MLLQLKQVEKYRAYLITVPLVDSHKLEIKINEKIGDDIVIALDSTEVFKVDNRREWKRQYKWHVRKGYMKIHLFQ